jgi:hypothetical protein
MLQANTSRLSQRARVTSGIVFHFAVLLELVSTGCTQVRYANHVGRAPRSSVALALLRKEARFLGSSRENCCFLVANRRRF